MKCEPLYTSFVNYNQSVHSQKKQYNHTKVNMASGYPVSIIR